MSRMKRVQPRNALFHVVSRIAHREFFFTESERDIVVSEMRRVAEFCGVNIAAYCIMSNHIHLLVSIERPENLERWLDVGDMALSDPSEFIPDGTMFKWRGVLVSADEKNEADALRKMSVLERYEMDEAEVLRRISVLYELKPRKLEELKDLWSKMNAAERMRDMERYLSRMYDLGFFMKTLKQNISQSYNYRHKHTGAMWEGRYKTTIIEKSIEVMSSVATYIDLNPVRAKMCEHPAHYRWCSMYAAIEGVPSSRNGYSQIYKTESWAEAKKLHDEAVDNRIASLTDSDEAKEDKVFMSGGVIGSHKFIADFVKANPRCFPAGRKSAAGNLRFGDKILRVLRRIQVF